MGKKPLCFFQTAETGKRTPNSGVKGSGANHYPSAPALKTYEPTLQFSPLPRSLDLFIRVQFQHTVLQPFRRIELIVHIAISVLPGTHIHLSQVKHLWVKCLGQGHTHRNNDPMLRRDTHDISLKICPEQGLNPHDKQRQLQSTTLQPLRDVSLYASH